MRQALAILELGLIAWGVGWAVLIYVVVRRVIRFGLSRFVWGWIRTSADHQDRSYKRYQRDLMREGLEARRARAKAASQRTTYRLDDV
jgi:hypothetical protein